MQRRPAQQSPAPPSLPLLSLRQQRLAQQLAELVFARVQVLPRNQRILAVQELVMLLRSDIGMTHPIAVRRPKPHVP